MDRFLQELCWRAGGQHSSASIVPGELCWRGLPPSPSPKLEQRVLSFAGNESMNHNFRAMLGLTSSISGAHAARANARVVLSNSSW